MYTYRDMDYCNSCADQIETDHTCDECGETSNAFEPPEQVSSERLYDSPVHCANGSECLDGLTLTDTHGESMVVGKILGTLSSCGVRAVVAAQATGGPIARAWAEHYDGVINWPDKPEVLTDDQLERILWAMIRTLRPIGGHKGTPQTLTMVEQCVVHRLPGAIAAMRERLGDGWQYS